MKHPIQSSTLHTTGKSSLNSSRKRQRSAGNEFDPVKFRVPTFDQSAIRCLYSAARGTDNNNKSSSSTIINIESITKAFEKYQAIYLPQCLQYPSGDENQSESYRDPNVFHWKDLSDVYTNLNEKDKESFCIENDPTIEGLAKDGKDDDMDNDSSFLKDQSESDAKFEDNRVGYCSFMVQNDGKALSDLLERLPVRDPVTTALKFVGSDCDTIDRGWDYEPCLWIFFGRNNSTDGKDLEGRPEHTDQISHDGTWHFQLSGTKRWLLRPTPQLQRNWKQDLDNSDGDNKEDGTDTEPEQIRIDCRQGDILIVNTRLWKHQTIIPSQKVPSVSYARDFWIHKDKPKGDRTETGGKEGEMTNVDGLYAMDDIEADTIIFKEDDMPDCELHRASEADKANCKVVELEDGMQAVVSSKHIRAGEFFCIPESSDEEDSDGDDEEEEVCYLAGEEGDCIENFKWET